MSAHKHRNFFKTDRDVMIGFRYFSAFTVIVNIAFIVLMTHTNHPIPNGALECAFLILWGITLTIATPLLPMCIVCWMELPEQDV